jgi:hypothetical protein
VTFGFTLKETDRGKNSKKMIREGGSDDEVRTRIQALLS